MDLQDPGERNLKVAVTCQVRCSRSALACGEPGAERVIDESNEHLDSDKTAGLVEIQVNVGT